MDNGSITTTCGETFSYRDHTRLARLIHLRFGKDIEAGAAAWRRLMQNSTTDDQFEMLVNIGYLHALEDKEGEPS